MKRFEECVTFSEGGQRGDRIVPLVLEGHLAEGGRGGCMRACVGVEVGRRLRRLLRPCVYVRGR